MHNNMQRVYVILGFKIYFGLNEMKSNNSQSAACQELLNRNYNNDSGWKQNLHNYVTAQWL